MPPAIVILELLVKYGPAVAQAAQRIVTLKDPTQADWDALFERAQKPYDQFIAEAEARAEGKP